MKRPGSLYLSAKAVYFSHAFLTIASALSGGSFFESEATISIAVAKTFLSSPDLSALIPLLPLLLREDRLVALFQLRHKAIHLGVVGQHEKIEGPAELRTQAVRGGDFLAPRKTKGLLLLTVHMVPASTETAVWRCVSPQ